MSQLPYGGGSLPIRNRLTLSVGGICHLLSLGVGHVRNLPRRSRGGLAVCDLLALGVRGVGDLLPLRVGRVPEDVSWS